MNATAGDTQGVGTIQSDDTLPLLSVNDVSNSEGNSGTGTMSFTVSLSAPAGPGGVTFDIATAPNTAIAPDDYVHRQVIGATIAAGQSTYTFDVTINGDTAYATSETFFVNVTNIAGATASDTQGVGTIQNDDVQPTFSVNDVSVTEGDSGTALLTFTVTMTGLAESNASVNWSTTNATATAGSDYVAASGSFAFAPGETSKQMSITVNGETTAEGDEHFTVDLSGATVATIADAQGFGVIRNDELQRRCSQHTLRREFQFARGCDFAFDAGCVDVWRNRLRGEPDVLRRHRKQLDRRYLFVFHDARRSRQGVRRPAERLARSDHRSVVSQRHGPDHHVTHHRLLGRAVSPRHGGPRRPASIFSTASTRRA